MALIPSIRIEALVIELEVDILIFLAEFNRPTAIGFHNIIMEPNAD